MFQSQPACKRKIQAWDGFKISLVRRTQNSFRINPLQYSVSSFQPCHHHQRNPSLWCFLLSLIVNVIFCNFQIQLFCLPLRRARNPNTRSLSIVIGARGAEFWRDDSAERWNFQVWTHPPMWRSPWFQCQNRKPTKTASSFFPSIFVCIGCGGCLQMIWKKTGNFSNLQIQLARLFLQRLRNPSMRCICIVGVAWGAE